MTLVDQSGSTERSHDIIIHLGTFQFQYNKNLDAIFKNIYEKI